MEGAVRYARGDFDQDKADTAPRAERPPDDGRYPIKSRLLGGLLGGYGMISTPHPWQCFQCIVRTEAIHTQWERLVSRAA